MTAGAARPLALVGSEAADDSERLQRVRTLLRPDFLAEVWDVEGLVFAPPRSHRLLGLRKCVVVDCLAGVRTPNTDLCRLCADKFKGSGLSLERFVATPCGKAVKGEHPCTVPGCQRPCHSVGLCQTHYGHWNATGLPVEDFVAERAKPLASFGGCQVLACSRSADTRAGLCSPHRQRWSRHRDLHPDAERPAGCGPLNRSTPTIS